MKISILTIFLLLAFIFVGCDTKEPISSKPNGIGPVANLELPAINDSLMKVGMNLFKTKCSECHTMEFKNSGPDISDLLYTKKPEWFMNFMLNKNEMLKRDASAIKTRANYQTDCGAAIHSESDARELLEYLRIYQIWLHEFNTK